VDAAIAGDVKVAAGVYTDTYGRPRDDITTVGIVTQVEAPPSSATPAMAMAILT
jgi:hypothetical protein